MIWLRTPERLLGLTFEALVERVLVTNEEMPAPERSGDGALIRVIDGGVELHLSEDGQVGKVRLLSEGCDGYRRYTWALPHGLSFQAGRSAVRAILGQPFRSGGGVVHPVLGPAPSFDDYNLDRHRLVVEYSPDGEAISSVSLIAR